MSLYSVWVPDCISTDNQTAAKNAVILPELSSAERASRTPAIPSCRQQHSKCNFHFAVYLSCKFRQHS